VVSTTDEFDNVTETAGVSVVWSVTVGDGGTIGDVTETTVLTDTKGKARVKLKLGKGKHKVTAKVQGSSHSVEFDADEELPPAALLTATVSPERPARLAR
jgi:hypothetical protein